MNKLYLILVFVFAVVLIQNSAAKNSEVNRPNVLFIFIDDLNTDLHCYGNKIVRSPNIDRLSAKGIHFSNAYCQWSVCGPSRASILCGQMPAQTGIRNLSTQLRDASPGIITLPQYFKNNGYITAAVGKVFDPRNVDDGHDTKSWSIPYNIHYNYPAEYGPFVKGQYRVTNNTATEMGPVGVDDDGYIDGQICLDALSKIDQFAEQPNQPFFLAVGFKKPHIPFIAPKKYWDLYNRDSISLAPFQKPAAGSPDFVYFDPEPSQYDDIPDLWTFDDITLGSGILDTLLQKKLIHGYYACVSYVDAQVGKLLAKLESLGLDENTIVVLLGDHGYHLGDHNQWGKHTQFEKALHAPLIMYFPKMAPAIVDNPVDFIDIYPTLTEMVFHTQPIQLSGNNLAPLLAGEITSTEPAVSEYRSNGHASYSFRTNNYRLTIWNDSSNDRPDQISWSPEKIFKAELYDYQIDPLETENVFYSERYIQIMDSMLQSAGNWWSLQFNHINNGTSSLPLKMEHEIPITNPVRDYITLPAQYGKVDLRIYNSNGQLIKILKQQAEKAYVGNLKKGHYLVLINWQEMDEVLDFRMIKI